MDLLGDMGEMEAHFGLFGYSVNLHTRLVHSLRRTCNILENHFGHTQWKHLGDVGQVEAHFVPFGDSVSLGVRYVHGLGLTYHRIGNHFGQMMGLLGDVGQMEARFGLF
jgi:hypothetical protein